MTPKERLDRVLVIQNALYELLTTEEADAYEVLNDHLNDLIGDLRNDYQETLVSEIWPTAPLTGGFLLPFIP